MPRTARKTGYHHGDLHRALIAAAANIIETDGPAALTLREAARRVGVSAAAPYRHFADKEALLAAVLEQGFTGLATALRSSRGTAKGAQGALVAVGKAYVRFAVENGPVYRLMFGPTIDKSKHPGLLAAGHTALGELIGAVEACHAAGLLKPGRVDEMALSGWALCHGLASLHADGALTAVMPVDIDRAADQLIRLLLHGVLR